MDALGLLREPAEALQELVQAPDAICAQSVLGVTTLAVQPHRDVELPGSGRHPLTGLLLTIAVSGDRKTSADRRASIPVTCIEARWRAEREAEMHTFMADHEAWRAAREDAKKTNKGKGRAQIRQALMAIGLEPKAPPHPMLLVEDTTPEAVVLHLRDGRPWCGIFSSEGGVLAGGPAFSAEKVMHTGALLNKLWDGEPIRKLRVLTGPAYLPGRRCSAHLMMQPIVADFLLGSATLDGVGTLSRTLVVAPESIMGTRMFQHPEGWCDDVMATYAKRVTLLLESPPRTVVDAPDVLDPLPLTLTSSAERLWIAYHDSVERSLGSGGELQPIRAFGAKLAEHAGRLASVLTVYADPDAGEVGSDALQNAVELARHYAAEMLRLAGGAAVAPDLALAQRLLTWWHARPDPRAHLAEVYQFGPYAISTAATAIRIITLLEEHNWLRRLKPGTVLDGRGRRDAWVLVS
jgi:hypothetical protein